MPIKVFFCYAHEDEILLNKLKSHLKPLQRQGLIDVWHDRDISAGMEWEEEINKHLNSAQIILLLVSPDFMNSDYCYGVEMKRALERHERGEAHVIPIILRHVYWQGAPLGKLQALPTDAQPVTDPFWHNLDIALYNVAEGIRKVVVTLLVQQAHKRGKDYIVHKCYNEALAAFEDAILYNPNDIDAHIEKGYVLCQLQQYKEAVLVFDHAIYLDPNQARAYNNKGVVLGNLKRYRDALEAFEQAIILAPEDAGIYANKGIALDELGRYREALAAFEDAKLLNSDLAIPKILYIKWARELLFKSNLTFLEVDTTGLTEDDEVIRILLVDRHGNSIFDTLLCSDRAVPPRVSYMTGIANNDLGQAPTCADVWEQMTNALTKKYVLSFNLQFDIEMLETTAKRYKLTMPSIEGDCLMLKVMGYSSSDSYSKLSTLCAHIGSPLADYPHQTALDRARGQIALLKAISKGIIVEEP